jgi:hypothetical protein
VAARRRARRRATQSQHVWCRRHRASEWVVVNVCRADSRACRCRDGAMRSTPTSCVSTQLRRVHKCVACDLAHARSSLSPRMCDHASWPRAPLSSFEDRVSMGASCATMASHSTCVFACTCSSRPSDSTARGTSSRLPSPRLLARSCDKWDRVPVRVCVCVCLRVVALRSFSLCLRQ